MDGGTALILGIILGPIGFALFLRFVVWNGVWWAVRRIRNLYRQINSLPLPWRPSAGGRSRRWLKCGKCRVSDTLHL